MDTEVFARIAEQKIQEAIEEGQFDNLPGKGKPLVFEDDFTTPAHLRLANKVLKNAGVLPEWMQLQKDISEERQEAIRQRDRLIRENQTRRARIAALSADHPLVVKYVEWHMKGRAVYLRRLKNYNTSVLKFCLIAPSTVEPFVPFRIDAEMASFDAEFTQLELRPEVCINEAEERPGKIKGLARTHYQQGASGGLLGGWLRTAGMFDRNASLSADAASEDQGTAQNRMDRKDREPGA